MLFFPLLAIENVRVKAVYDTNSCKCVKCANEERVRKGGRRRWGEREKEIRREMEKER